MYITLYEGVEIRSDYSVVFDASTSFWGTDTPFAQYLASKNYYTEEIENTYFSNSGSITISWPVYKKLPQGITYMRMFTDNNEIKYFFVDSYEYRNELLILNYTLDVWHTYSNSMKINRGIINRARYLQPGTRRALPAAYQSNEAIRFNGSIQDFYLVMEYQIYRVYNDDDDDKTDIPNRTTERYSRTGLLGRDMFIQTEAGAEIKPTEVITENTQFLFSVEEAVHIINNLVANQGVQPIDSYKRNDDWGAGGFDVDVTGKQKIFKNNVAIYSTDMSTPGMPPNQLRYEITQIYTVPRDILDPLGFKKYPDNDIATSLLILDSIDYPGGGVGHLVGAEFYFEEYKFTHITTPKADYEVTFKADDKMVGVGLPSMFVPLPYTGQDKKVKFQAQLSDFGFNMIMIAENGVSDITSHFALPMPYLVPSGEDRQLAVMNKKSAQRQAVASSVGMALSMATAAGAVITGVSAAANAGTLNQKAYDARYTTEQPEAVGGLAYSSSWSGTESKAAYRQGVYSSLRGSFNNITNKGVGLTYQTLAHLNAIEALNRPASTGSASDSTPLPLVNATLGFNTYSIVPYNQEEIDYLISQIGYTTWIEQNDYHTSRYRASLEGKYEPISFATIHISGPFPNDVAAALEGILTDGALISYTPDIFSQL